MKSWQYKVVKSSRGMQGEWFRYPVALTTVTLGKARAYAEAFAAEQCGVVGTRVDILTREITQKKNTVQRTVARLIHAEPKAK